MPWEKGRCSATGVEVTNRTNLDPTRRSAQITFTDAPAIIVAGGGQVLLDITRLLLAAEVDLLWFGGIGTYVKAADESHADAGDRANDALRLDGRDLRAKVIGEGANLGMTQRGRLEFAAIGGRLALTHAAVRERFDAFWLTLPVLGRLALGYNAARFANTLAMLAGAGVPILKALQAAAETLSNQALRRDAQEALVLVREGAPLASALAQKKRFPALLAMFARLGEQTGQLPLMLQRAAKQLSAEVQRRAMQLATLLEPLLIVAMGGAVMLIVLAVLLPIIQLNAWVK